MSVHSHPDEFKAALRGLAGPVAMVTTRVEDRPWGLTISACCSLSVDPPQILVSLGSHTTSVSTALASGRFGLSVLRGAHKSLASLGAAPQQPKFIDGFLEGSGPDDAFVDGQCPPGLRSPMVAGALLHLDCSVARSFEVDDHTLLIGLVEGIAGGDEREGQLAGPLLYFDRAFRHLGEQVA